MNLNSRYKQATKEALWAFGLTILYMVGWCVFAYGLPNTKGFLTSHSGLNFPAFICQSSSQLSFIFVLNLSFVISI